MKQIKYKRISETYSRKNWNIYQKIIIILPESWTRGLVKKSLHLTKRYDQTNPPQIFA